jgi:hypothetical protein
MLQTKRWQMGHRIRYPLCIVDPLLVYTVLLLLAYKVVPVSVYRCEDWHNLEWRLAGLEKATFSFTLPFNYYYHLNIIEFQLFL